MSFGRHVNALATVVLWLTTACTGRDGSSQAESPAAASAQGRGSRPAALTTPAPRETGCQYDVSVNARLTRLSAEFCCRGLPPRALVPSDETVRALLASAERSGPDGTQALATTEDLALNEGGCVRYQIDLGKATRQRSGLLGARRRAGALLIAPDLWLWRPDPLPQQLSVRFELPPGMDVAVPWDKVGDVHRLDATAFAWKGQSAFGKLGRAHLRLEGADIELVTLDARAARDPALHHWLDRSAQAVATVYGNVPAERALLVVMPDPGRPRGFGLTLRGGGPSIVLLLGTTRDAGILADDWSAVHELLHLGIPHTDLADAWLFEGLVTYYTSVARARAGQRSAERAWSELVDGFERGRSTGTGRSLRDESAAMSRSGAYFRVYWAGAAMALLADVELRRAGVKGGLDAALRALRTCCASSRELFSAERLIRELDRAAGAPVFAKLSRQHLDRARFPNVEPTLRWLGVQTSKEGVVLSSDAPGVTVRNAIIARAR